MMVRTAREHKLAEDQVSIEYQLRFKFILSFSKELFRADQLETLADQPQALQAASSTPNADSMIGFRLARPVNFSKQ
jgi:hypothetical protein